MEEYLSTELRPYVNGAYGRQNVNTQDCRTASSAGADSFQEALQSALRTTESMEGIFREASEAYGVDLNLLKAIGKAESNFNPQAVSSAGAQGVMQLMPATARSLGVVDSFDARSNIFGGAKYIAGLLERYQGNTVLALSAYNAGSGNVEKYGGVPPFAETQNYVKKVLAYAGEEIDLSGVMSKSGAAVSGSFQNALSGLVELVSKNGTKGLGFSYDQKNAQYMVEMMRLQMQNVFQEEVFSNEGDEKEEEKQAVGALV